MDYAVYAHDVEHIIIDNLQFLLSGQGLRKGMDKFDLQDYAIEAFRHFSTTHNVHITIVIHPRKHEDHAPLSTASVFGTYTHYRAYQSRTKIFSHRKCESNTRG
jgi:twinkle protein